MRQFRNTNYFITESGEVYHKRKSGLRQVKPTISKDGYIKFGLFNEGIRTHYRAHRLVGECYIPNPNNLPQINHINGIKTDNRIENLEWITPKQNTEHSLINGFTPVGEKHWKSKLTNEDVMYIRNNYIYKDSKFGSTGLAKKFGIGHQQILKIVKNKTWKYAEK